MPYSHCRGASGNAEPQRVLKIPHRGFQFAVDEEREEIYLDEPISSTSARVP